MFLLPKGPTALFELIQKHIQTLGGLHPERYVFICAVVGEKVDIPRMKNDPELFSNVFTPHKVKLLKAQIKQTQQEHQVIIPIAEDGYYFPRLNFWRRRHYTLLHLKMDKNGNCTKATLYDPKASLSKVYPLSDLRTQVKAAFGDNVKIDTVYMGDQAFYNDINCGYHVIDYVKQIIDTGSVKTNIVQRHRNKFFIAELVATAGIFLSVNYFEPLSKFITNLDALKFLADMPTLEVALLASTSVFLLDFVVDGLIMNFFRQLTFEYEKLKEERNNELSKEGLKDAELDDDEEEILAPNKDKKCRNSQSQVLQELEENPKNLSFISSAEVQEDSDSDPELTDRILLDWKIRRQEYLKQSNQNGNPPEPNHEESNKEKDDLVM